MTHPHRAASCTELRPPPPVAHHRERTRLVGRHLDEPQRKTCTSTTRDLGPSRTEAFSEASDGAVEPDKYGRMRSELASVTEFSERTQILSRAKLLNRATPDMPVDTEALALRAIALLDGGTLENYRRKLAKKRAAAHGKVKHRRRR